VCQKETFITFLHNFILKEIDELKSTNRQLEDTITRLKRDLKKKEDENEELTDTLEVLRSWYEEPRELAQRMELRKLNPN
jgi:FtsZ-binding cell division protein ZapB